MLIIHSTEMEHRLQQCKVSNTLQKNKINRPPIGVKHSKIALHRHAAQGYFIKWYLCFYSPSRTFYRFNNLCVLPLSTTILIPLEVLFMRCPPSE